MGKRNRFGPGFLVTAAFIGPGTVTTCTLAGARFGYSLVYVIIFASLTAYILQEMTGRLSLASGRGLAESLRDFSDKPAISWTVIIIILSSITFGCAAYEAGNIIGGSMGLEMVTGIDRKIWGGLISLIAIFILSRKRYKIVEKFLIGLVFMMSMAFIGTLIIISPDMKMILKGMIPSFPKNSFFLIVGLIGTTVVPYNLFLHSAAVREKWKSIEKIGVLRKDLFVAILLGGVISASIIITSSAALYGSGKDVKSGADLAVQLKPLFGGFTELLFGAGFFAAGMSSALTAPYAAAFAASGALGWKGGQESKKFSATWLSVILIGFIVSVFGFKPIAVIVFAQVANGIVLPIAAVFLLIFLNRKKDLARMANRLPQNIISSAVILIVVFLGIWSVVRLFLK